MGAEREREIEKIYMGGEREGEIKPKRGIKKEEKMRRDIRGKRKRLIEIYEEIPFYKYRYYFIKVIRII